LVQGNLRGLAEGALMAALCVVLGLAAYYVPVVGMAAALTGPVPIVVAYLRQGPRVAFLAAVVAGILLSAFLGAMQGLVMGFAFGSMGLALGMGFSRRAAAFTTVLWASLAVAAATALSLGLSFLFLHISPASMMEEMLQAYESAGEMWGRLGVPGMQEQARTMVAMMREALALLWPATFTGAFVVAAAINWAVARGILRRLGYRVPDPTPFVEWRVPRWVVIPFLLGWAAMAVGPHYHLQWLYRVGANLSMLLSVVMAAEGAAVALSFLRRWLGGSATLVLVAFLFLLPGVAWPLIVWLGVFDLIFDYRRLSSSGPGRG